ncbi:hypothetical protein IAT38_004994 [Cryptococcus sp. DSM 104549]
MAPTNDPTWEERWSQGRTGWDQSGCHPNVVNLLESRQSDELGIPRNGTALIPGCGMGYDLQLFAARGLDATGLEISSTGRDAALAWLALQGDTPGRKEVVLEDFFEFDPAEKVDVIFDYTFLCALQPVLRSRWARQMSSLSRSGTTLITLMFPLPPQAAPVGGPPFALSEEIYKELLEPEGWEMVWGQEIDVPQRKTGPPGGEKLAVWKKK